MSWPSFSLRQLGWRPCFALQVSLEESGVLVPARVTGVHRALLDTLTEAGELQVTISSAILQHSLSASVAVGDWVLVNAQSRVVRLLDRLSTLGRLTAGERQQRQLIAANIDTLFIVTSCNDDFNPSRLERYLALATEAGVEPVVVLTKADLVTDTAPYTEALHAVAPEISVCPVNAVAADSVAVLSPWLATGQTVAFVGSSGVGKSTLANTLMNAAKQVTAGIREDDAKGRHTTTSRQLFALPGGAWVIDTPGMRELRLDISAETVGAVFGDIEALARQCRFRDCAHQGDEGCAVSAAVAQGHLDARRLASYHKLSREAAHASRTTWQRRESERKFGRMARSVVRQKRIDRGQD